MVGKGTVSRDTGCIHDIVCDTAWGRELLEEGGPLVLMVSGGSDSVALLYLVHELRKRLGLGSLRVVHVNHMLRGEASDGDEAFVCRITGVLGIDCAVHRLDIPALAQEQGGNIEAAARHARYTVAEQELDDLCLCAGVTPNMGRIAVAHTQNDQIESFYMRSIVGTGPGGFAGMGYRTGRVVRPLMDLTRDDLREYLRRRAMPDTAALRTNNNAMGEGASASAFLQGAAADKMAVQELWREDATNADTDHFRSFVRHELVPRARIWNPRLEDTLCRTMGLIADEDAMLDTFVEGLMAKAAAPAPGLIGGAAADDGVLSLDCALLATYPVPILRRVAYKAVRSMLPPEMRLENQHVEKLVSGIRQVGGAFDGDPAVPSPSAAFSITLPMGIQVCDEYGKLVFTPAGSACSQVSGMWLDIPGKVELAGGMVLHACEVEVDATLRSAIMSADNNRAYIDLAGSACSTDRLWVRFPQPGDVLSPLGMGGSHKKIQDILVDRKVPGRLRAGIPVVCEGCSMDDRIIWLAGIAVSESFKVTPQTAKTVLLTLEAPVGGDKVG